MVLRVLCVCNSTMKFSHVELLGILGCEIYCCSAHLLEVFSYSEANYLSKFTKCSAVASIETTLPEVVNVLLFSANEESLT